MWEQPEKPQSQDEEAAAVDMEVPLEGMEIIPPEEMTHAPVEAPVEPGPKLLKRSIALLVILPFLFIPLFRQTFPHVGLWPAAAVLTLSLSLLASGAGEWDRRVSKAGLWLSMIALGAFALSLLSAKIPGVEVPYSIAENPVPRTWPVRIIGFVALVISIILHECAHALAALFSGDTTARDAGRISLNPLRHIDLFGSIILPAILSFLPAGVVFGWAKPVPVNPGNYRNFRRGHLATSVAGVAVNFFLALFSCAWLMVLGILLHMVYPGIITQGFGNPFSQVVIQGIPAAGFWLLVVEFLKAGIWVNMTLFMLNILPIPPLDGYGIIEGLVPQRVRGWMTRIRAIGSVAFLVLVFTEILDKLLLPGFVIALLLNAFAAMASKLG